MLYLLIALLIWASSFTAGKIAYEAIDPALTTQLRLTIAALISLPLFLAHRHEIPRSTYTTLAGLAFIAFPIGIFVQFIGLSYTSASSAVTIIGTEPLLVLLIGFLFFRERVQWYDWLLSIIAFLGIGLLVAGSQQEGDVSIFGLSLVLVAGIGFVFYIFLSKSIMQHIETKLYTSTVLILGAILCLPFTFALTQHWQLTWHLPSILAVLYLGICCSWLAYRFWNIGLQRTPSHISGMLIALEPVFGVIFAMILLGDRMSFLTTLGSALVIGAAMLSTLIPLIKQRFLSPTIKERS